MNLFSPQGPLAFGVVNPTFHITTAFADDSNINPFNYNGPHHSEGNLGIFRANLQACEVGNGLTGDACKNWDGNPGVWIDVLGGSGSTTVKSPSPGATGFQDLALSSNGLFLTVQNLVKTVRYRTYLAQGDTVLGGPLVCAGGVSCRQAVGTSSVFNVVLIPTAVVQVNAIPYSIIYQPPGNLSIATFQTMTTFGTQYNIANDKEVDTSYTTDQSS
jgi:hypothetical protein